MTFATYLRVYIPGDGRLVTEHAPDPRPRVLVRGAYGVWFESSREDAFVIERDGQCYICPRHPRLRMLEGLLAFRNAYPAPVSSSLVDSKNTPYAPRRSTRGRGSGACSTTCRPSPGT